MAHSIVPHPSDPRRMWVGISAVGVFHTADGGATWEARNGGVRAAGSPDEYPETGQCVHKFGLHPDRPEVLYQQDHTGVYRSDDGEGPYHPTLPANAARYPHRSGCFVDSSERAHHVFTAPPFVSAMVTGGDCDTVARWAWRGNADTPGAPTVWR
jgi:hypothetical protein